MCFVIGGVDAKIQTYNIIDRRPLDNTYQQLQTKLLTGILVLQLSGITPNV